MESKKKVKRSKGSVAPERNENGYINSSFELHLDSDQSGKNNSKMLNTFKSKVHETKKKQNALEAIIEAKKGARKWRQYSASKRLPTKSKAQQKLMKEGNETEHKGTGLDDIDSRVVEPLNMGIKMNNTLVASQTKALFDHFKELGRSGNPDAIVDLEFVETLLKNGANINCADRHGQTLLHEVARMWHTDVAKFLLDNGADINHLDKFGRTPLHVAAAVDYPEMCELLIERGANKEARTTGELQTPVHYAAKNDATKSLRTLIKRGCLYEKVRDYRGRTPLYVAAQLDRSDSAHILIDYNAPATVRDDNGQVCLAWMVIKMPLVAIKALNQFWTCDRPNRKQYFDMHHLVHCKKLDPELLAITPLFAAVAHKQYDLLMNKTLTKLIDVMWVQFARWRAILNLFLNFVYILLWSLLGILVEYDNRHQYIMPDHWWRIVLWVAALGFTAWQFVEEFLEYKRSRHKHIEQKRKREKEIDDDLNFCHERWPEEASFLMSEKNELLHGGPTYFSDLWNIFDWINYIFLLVCIGTHLADIINHTTPIARAHIRLMAVNIILLWLRLMKNVRCFALLGPFIVMLTHILKDVVKFGFLYLEFYIPFVFAFYMIFGGDKMAYTDGDIIAENVTVQGFENFNNALFSMFRLTLVDSYDFDGMTQVDPIMSKLLVGFWLALSAILCLNLFIALLSDTFQRVYDNAKANAVMQKAQSIMSFWEGMSDNSRDQFLQYISVKCSPLKEYYDDDMTEEDEEDLKKVTIQIKEQLDDLEEKWTSKVSDQKTKEISKHSVTVEKFENEVEILREGIKKLQVRQNEIMDSVQFVHKLLLRMTGQDEASDNDGRVVGDEVVGDDTDSGRSKSKPNNINVHPRSSTPPSFLDGSVRKTPHSVVPSRQTWSTEPVVDVSTPRFSSGGEFQFQVQDPGTDS